MDIGSGDGFILQNLVKKKIAKNYSAVDIYLDNFILELISLPYAQSISFKKDLPKNPEDKGDCILLLDVLEHCEKDEEVLGSALNTGISPGALFIITAPAFQRLFSQHDHLLKHFRRYTLSRPLISANHKNWKLLERATFFLACFLRGFFKLFLKK